MTPRRTTPGLVGWAARHRGAVTFLLLFLIASPATPDDRQLMQANAGAKAWVLLIMDSSHSMNDEFSDLYRLPAYMDDFVYVENSTNVNPDVSYGSKIAIAKSVVRDVIAKSETGSGINWAFSYYRNPGQVIGATDTSTANGAPIGGAKATGDALENGGLEWLYFANCVNNGNNTGPGSCLGGQLISDTFPTAQFPDLQEGRFLQFGHKVMRNYYLDSRPPFTDNNPNLGTWRGAFGPHGLAGVNRGTVIYRNANALDSATGLPIEVRMSITAGNYGDEQVIVKLEKWGPPGIPTATITNTPTVTSTETPTRTPTATKTAAFTKTQTPTPTITSTVTVTSTKTNTKTPSITPTASKTFTVTPTSTTTNTQTITKTPSYTTTPSVTSTGTNTPTSTRTETPTITSTTTPTFTKTLTFTITPTKTITLTPTKTNTVTITKTPTVTFTKTNTFTPTNTFTVTQTKTITLTPTQTRTFTVTSTKTNTQTPTTTFTNSPTNTITQTPTNTQTLTPVPPTNTSTKTPITPTSTNTKTPVPPTKTHTKTPVPPTSTATRTPTITSTPAANTPTPTYTLPPQGSFPAPSLLPVVARWFAPAVRGLLAMAPPPPVQTPGPCQFITGAAGTKPQCAPCPWDTAIPPTHLCAFVDGNADGVINAGDQAPSLFIPLPANLRGFDDPQADGDTSYALLATIRVKYTRGDLYALPFADGTHRYETRNTGNPPWGSCTTAETPNAFNCSVKPDHDADQIVDNPTMPDRHNHGMYAALYDWGPDFSPRPIQQYPNDAFAGKSCPLDLPSCDPFVAGQDCGGFAHFHSFTSNNGTFYNGSAPQALGASPYQSAQPPGIDLWPVIPFSRDWPPYDAGSISDYPSPGPTSSEAIRRLLRFVSSIVSYNSAAAVTSAYTLAEPSTEVVATASGTPLAGALEDAYKYFETSVFDRVGAGTAVQDPAIDCRNYIIVFITDGNDQCNSDPCAGGRNGLPFPDGGVSKDLALIDLPESVPGSSRAAAQLVDPSIRLKGVPVNVVAMANAGAAYFPTLQCIADNSGGDVFLATNRDALESALETILDFKRKPNTFAAPALPAFGSAAGGDTAIIGAVIPSHLNPSGVLSSWSVWSGSVKSFQLDSNGLIPVVTGAPPTATTTPTPGGPTPGPPGPTTTPTALLKFPEESAPNNASAILRKPVWNAGRVLGYTNPVPDLPANGGASTPTGDAGAIQTWGGRKMVFARDTATPGSVPMVRSSFLPNTGSCQVPKTPGGCFNDLMKFMNLLPWSNANQTLAQFTVKFLRGGETATGSGFGIGRDEILNQVKPVTIPTIGPAADPHFSYYYQDDVPEPGSPPQAVATDGANSPPGYPHRLGDIFHSESLIVQPPRYFQYLSLNLAPNGPGSEYETFSALHHKRRKVVFVGSNDGFLHAFDAGVWNGDTTNFPNTFDLGSGREIFAYTPRAAFLGDKFPSLLDFSPQPQYFVDGSPVQADVFIDPEFVGGSPDPTERVWRTVVVGGLRQGGSGYYALDVTQPDHIETNTALTTFGEMLDPKTNSPHCLDGSGSSCTAGPTIPSRPYPSILWEFTDTTPAGCTDSCSGVLGAPALGETWSRPILGRIKIVKTVTPLAFEDRYVAIFGGGLDPIQDPGDDPVDTTIGRAFYMVDIETGEILFKTHQGQDDGGTTIDFGPMPAPPAVADYNDDGYLDVVYIGDVRGNMWRINLQPDATSSPVRGELQGDGQVHGYMPFLIFDTCKDVSAADFPRTPPKVGKNCIQPIFYEPGIVYLGGAASPPALGIAFGTGDRASLTRSNPVGGTPPVSQFNGFYYVIDGGADITKSRNDLVDLTPPSTPCVPYDPAVCGTTGFVLDYETGNEKTTSTVFSTLGELSIVTFTPDTPSPCATDGSSFRYRFFYLTGQPGYTTPDYSGYKEDLGPGYAAAGQSISPDGDIIDTTLLSGGAIRQDVTPAALQTIEQNWKEQQ